MELIAARTIAAVVTPPAGTTNAMHKELAHGLFGALPKHEVPSFLLKLTQYYTQAVHSLIAISLTLLPTKQENNIFSLVLFVQIKEI